MTQTVTTVLGSMQVGSGQGEIGFGWNRGSVGQVAFIRVQSGVEGGSSYQDVRLSMDEGALARAAETIIGRMDMQDLTGLDFPTGSEEEVRPVFAAVPF
jgi:hypothetical protein